MFVGMDVHRNRTQVCVLDHKGNERRNRNVTNDRESLRKEDSAGNLVPFTYTRRAVTQPNSDVIRTPSSSA